MTYTFRDYYIPDRMLDGLTRYLEDGIPPGGFLTAVIENDLMEAVGRADEENLKNLPAYAAYLYNVAPIGSYGSPKRMSEYLRKKREERVERAVR